MSTAATGVRVRPILFSDEMVRATREGRMTQTRRVVTAPVIDTANRVALSAVFPGLFTPYHPMGDGSLEIGHPFPCPYGTAGDRLYVREAHCDTLGEWKPRVAYRADGTKLLPGWRWTPSIHMPRALSRIWLQVTDVRVERVQEITEADAVAEGATLPVWAEGMVYSPASRAWNPADRPFGNTLTGARGAFAAVWDSVAPRRSGWRVNPWVWVITFRVLDGEVRP